MTGQSADLDWLADYAEQTQVTIILCPSSAYLKMCDICTLPFICLPEDVWHLHSALHLLTWRCVTFAYLKMCDICKLFVYHCLHASFVLFNFSLSFLQAMDYFRCRESSLVLTSSSSSASRNATPGTASLDGCHDISDYKVDVKLVFAEPLYGGELIRPHLQC